MCGFLVCGFWLIAPSLYAKTLVLSSAASEVLGGLAVGKGDASQYDSGNGIGTPYFSAASFSGAANVDAFDVLPNGHYVLSTAATETLGGLSFNRADLVEYDPLGDSATLFFDHTLFSGSADIDAVSVLGNGHIVLSTAGSETLAGLAFRDGDLVEYDPVKKTATLRFNEDLLSSGSDIDAVDVLHDGRLLLSTIGGSTLAGLTFKDGDLVTYDPISTQAQLFLTEASAFSGNANVDAASLSSVPEPTTLSLLGLAGLGLLAARQRHLRIQRAAR